MNFWR